MKKKKSPWKFRFQVQGTPPSAASDTKVQRHQESAERAQNENSVKMSLDGYPTRSGGGKAERERWRGNPGANLKSISHRCYLFEVAFVWDLTKETINSPLGCLQGGYVTPPAAAAAKQI